MEDEDDYTYYGTPLPDQEDEFVQRKKAAKELEVRDDRGRQRFHGAFTGGFSAGYFNTVGTKEGWTPSTFVSSRNKTGEKFQQNPEDFMDEEDLGEFGIASRKIHTTSKFNDSVEDEKRKRKFVELDSVIPGIAPLKDIVKPVRESIGVEILKKLGWRLGQGIGPRTKKQQNTKIYGCALPDAPPTEEDDSSALLFTFAPTDSEGMACCSKDDHFGLGYTGLSKESVLTARTDTFTPITTKSWLKKDKKKLVIAGQAFGVGAFEDDDEDIYSKDDMSQYDFSDMEGKASHSSKKGNDSNTMNDLNKILEGFCLASHPPALRKYYPPPDLPHKYNPVRVSLSKTAVEIKPQHRPHQRLTADGRSLLLGEKKFHAPQASNDQKTMEQKPTWQEKLSIAVAAKTSHSFRPFPNDELKQKRYEEFVKLKDSGEVEKLVQPSQMTEWECQQELEEFDRASVLFKPLSSVLSSKFESRSSLSIEHEVMDALLKAKNEKNQKPLDRRKLVGCSSRKTVEWHPTSLLCKRFNVPNPYPNSADEPITQKSKSLFEHMNFSSNLPESCTASSSSSNIKFEKSKVPDSSEELKDSIENPVQSVPIPVPTTSFVTSENKRPPIDFFKDIFEKSSSEEEDDNNDESPTTPSLLIPETSQQKTVTEDNQCPIATTSETTPTLPKADMKRVGFGVFANIDLDALNERTPAPQSNCSVDSAESRVVKDPSEKTDEVSEIKTEAQDTNDALYGPALPPDYCEDSSSTVNKNQPKKHLKHKSKHKHKHHKHKSKKKKKKKSSHQSSEDSSSESYDDVPPIVIIEKLKKLQKIIKSDRP